ncbi:hypothetical protein FDP41_010063 [Naegleria fowleri]|uniref:Metallo-beta-lactamase domain-containing protein n=1 Tax=Naegleria fowleri TaxID=5763 RepID=A0A6A5BCN3_NAEFO|nr:uncharacterized protein FDP41_010063 [Naegleria fowleri]KAF0971840.1 hypothetical protein FDP41_010063 [Naegleria fowleri]
MSKALTFLGTSSGVPTPLRNVSSCGVQLENGEVYLMDCGEGTQHQLQKSILKSGKISRIFVTHLHGDHCYGLPGLLCTLSGNNPVTRTVLLIVGPLGLKNFLRQTLSLSDAHLNFRLDIHELVPPDTDEEGVKIYDEEQCPPPLSCEYESSESTTDNVPRTAGTFIYLNKETNSYPVFDLSKTDARLTIQAAPILHRVFCVGYVFTENDKPGTLDMEKCKQLGVPKGPLLGQLKNGKEVTLENGVTVKPEDVVGPTIKGKKLVMLGDTHDPKGISQIAMNCDVIVHESTLEDGMQEMCIDRGHSTPSMAAKFALSLNARRLILTHFSARYVEEGKTDLHENEVSVSLLKQQAQAIFPNVDLASDFATFTI